MLRGRQLWILSSRLAACAHSPSGRAQQQSCRRLCSSEGAPSAPSNEVRARAYLKEYGLGPRASDETLDVEADPRRAANGPTSSLRNIPVVAGDLPEPAELVDFLATEGGGIDIVNIDISKKATFTDNLIICTGRSPAHLRDLADRVTRELRRCSVTVDGDTVALSQAQSEDWLVVDAGRTVIHFLLEETRSFYALEDLWIPDAVPEQEPEYRS